MPKRPSCVAVPKRTAVRADGAGAFTAEPIVGAITFACLLVFVGSCPDARAEAPGAASAENCAPVLRQLFDAQRIALVADAQAAAMEQALERERRESAVVLEHSAAALRAFLAEVEAQPEPPSRVVWLSVGIAVGAVLVFGVSSIK